MPYLMEYNPYDGGHVLAQVQLLLFAALAFTWLHRKGLYPRTEASLLLDSDWFYRKLATATAMAMASRCALIYARLSQLIAMAAGILPGTWVHNRSAASNGRFVITVVILLLLLVLYLLPQA